MVIGFGDKIYHKYNYIYNIVGGLIFLVFSLIILISCWDIIFSSEIIDFDSYLTQSDSEIDKLIRKKVSIKIYNCYGMYFHEVKSNNINHDYYLVELEDGSLMALQTDPSNGDIFNILSEKTLTFRDRNESDTYYEHVGYLRKFTKYTNGIYLKYICDLKGKKIIADDVVVREIFVDDANDRIWVIICLIISFPSGILLLNLGIRRLKE